VGSAGGPDSQAAVLAALQEIHWAVHRGFWAYQSACEERRQLAVDVGELSQQLAGEVLVGLGLELHPEKTQVVDLREGREGFDFLGCHFRARVSGRMLERGVRRYYLQRWPSQRAMKRVRGKIKAKTGRGRAGQDIREIIADLNPILRGWGNYFRTGNAAKKFNQTDRYVVDRLRGLMCKRYGRNLKPGQWKDWDREWFEAHGLYRLRGTVRYPGYAS
jgi:RNA-directed DNA polymerase